MDQPQYFIVRVYRRAPGADPELEGVVESVATRRQQAFTTRDELWAILRELPAAPRRSRASGGRDRC
jgi:hypothetical protein